MMELPLWREGVVRVKDEKDKLRGGDDDP